MVIDSLGTSLRTLILDSMHIWQCTLCAILNLRSLEHLSLAMCQIKPDDLQWFFTGFPVMPVCEHNKMDQRLWALSDLFQGLDSMSLTSAARAMPHLKELDLKYLDIVRAPWLRGLHMVRLGLSDGSVSLTPEDSPASSSSIIHDIHIDVRGCKNLSLADIQGMETTWPGTCFTPSLKAIREMGAPPRVPATPLPELAIPFAVQAPGATNNFAMTLTL